MSDQQPSPPPTSLDTPKIEASDDKINLKKSVYLCINKAVHKAAGLTVPGRSMI